jgi:phosphoglycolate phosphatase-like HAD superfamily hydrolase
MRIDPMERRLASAFYRAREGPLMPRSSYDHVTRRQIAGLLGASGLALGGCSPDAGPLVVTAPEIPPAPAARIPLASWNDSASKSAILDFVSAVTNDKGPGFAPPSERVAVFDNDGTLWVEQPLYTEFAFVLDRAKEMMAKQPDLARKPPFKALVEAASNPAKLTEADLGGLLAATHSGMAAEEFTLIVSTWLDKARHPKFNRPYTSCIYQPMLELIDFLRSRQFKVFIVSGGGVDFMRAFAEKTYGIAPDQVIGSSGQGSFTMKDGVASVMKEPKLGSLDDKSGKPVNIALHIGRRPLAAFGNSDGDLEMLQYATSGEGRRFGLIVHHDDADREYAYDRDSRIGTLSAALDEGTRNGWTIVSMRNDWKQIFPSA